MTARQHNGAANLERGSFSSRPAPFVRQAISWLVFLGAAGWMAHLFHTRVDATPANSARLSRFGDPKAVESAPQTALGGDEPAWKAKIDAVTKTGATPVEICRHLRELWPALPEAGQLDVLSRFVNLLPDRDYGAVGDLAATMKLPDAGWPILAADAFTRPNSVKLPILVEILAHGVEPERTEARAELVAQLGADYGEDWSGWSRAIAAVPAVPAANP
jgi:hypothetical protein